MAQGIRLTRILARANQIAADLHDLHFGALHRPTVAWRPPLNVYVFGDRFEVCVELAGMAKSDIEVQVESRRLAIRGHREPPEQSCGQPACGRILVMEIPEGGFERIIEFPREVATDGVTARQENGWLWITLPLAS
jgi:HSP20 family protein